MAKDEKWMSKAFTPANRGKLHRKLGIPQGQKIPADKLAKAAKSDDPSLRREVAAAKIGKRFAGKRHGSRSSSRR